jgi:hypothetical protein
MTLEEFMNQDAVLDDFINAAAVAAQPRGQKRKAEVAIGVLENFETSLSASEPSASACWTAPSNRPTKRGRGRRQSSGRSPTSSTPATSFL